jgi:hypothetical protein
MANARPAHLEGQRLFFTGYKYSILQTTPSFFETYSLPKVIVNRDMATETVSPGNCRRGAGSPIPLISFRGETGERLGRYARRRLNTPFWHRMEESARAENGTSSSRVAYPPPASDEMVGRRQDDFTQRAGQVPAPLSRHHHRPRNAPRRRHPLNAKTTAACEGRQRSHAMRRHGAQSHAP